MINKNHFLVRWWVVIIVLGMTAILSAEIKLRLEYKKTLILKDKKNRGNDRSYKKDPDLIYAGIPNVRHRNSQGFLDTEHSFVKPDNTFRIIIIGASIAQGHGVPLQGTFGKILEKRLNEKYPNRKFEVIILAEAGYTTPQKIILLKKDAFRYNPDLILWSYGLNDPGHPIFHNIDNMDARLFYQPKLLLWFYLNRQLFYLTETVKARALKCDPEYHAFLHCVYWDDVVTSFKKISTISHKKRVPVILLIHPVFSKEMGNFEFNPFAALDTKLTALAAANDMATINIFEGYQHFDFSALTQNYLQTNSIDPWHPNAEGQRIAGEYIATILEKNFLKP